MDFHGELKGEVLMSDININFLNETFLFPEEIDKYIFYCDQFQSEHDLLLKIIYNRIDNFEYSYPDTEFQNSLRSICQKVICLLAENNIFNITEDDLLIDNSGYKTFLLITKEAADYIKQIRIEEFEKLKDNYNVAKDSALASIEGSGLALISNSIVSHLVFASLESFTISHQEAVAQKKLRNAKILLTQQSKNTLEQLEHRYLIDVLYPAYLDIVETFISSIIDKYLNILQSNGIFEYNKIKNFNLERSIELLSNLEFIQEKSKVLIQAFKECPYNPLIYQKMFEIDMLDENTIKVMKYFQQEKSLIAFLNQLADSAFTDNPNDINLIKRSLTYLAKLEDKNYQQIFQEKFADMLRKIDNNIEKIYNESTNSFELNRLFMRLSGGSTPIHKDDVKLYVNSNLLTKEINLLLKICNYDFLADSFKKYQISASSIDEFKELLIDNFQKNLSLLYDQYIQNKFAEQSAQKHTLRKRIIFISILVAIPLLLYAKKAITQAYENHRQYDTAIELLNNGSYDDAIKILQEIDNYKDSTYQLKEAFYQKGISLYSAKDYSDAIKVWNEIESIDPDEPNYKDISEKIEQAQLQQDLVDIFEKQNKIRNSFSNPTSDEAEFISKIISFVNQPKEIMEEYGDIDFSCMTMKTGEYTISYSFNGSFCGLPVIYDIFFDVNSKLCSGLSIDFELESKSYTESYAVDMINSFIGKAYSDYKSDSTHEYFWDIDGISECRLSYTTLGVRDMALSIFG